MADRITTLEQLEALYGLPGETSTVKEVDTITPHYRAFIEASPFAALATTGPEGLDCSPRGDKPGFIRVHDERTLLLPDRRGNNRVDSLRNVMRDPNVALLFLIPGAGTTLRVNGCAHLSVETQLLESFAVEEKAPRHGDQRRQRLFPVRARYCPLRPVESAKACRSQKPAQPGRDFGRLQRQPRWRRRL
jgi:predicted pyridoxine 5'-phosphate oxidase superfamily flavin-nucleotide-binding protein